MSPQEAEIENGIHADDSAESSIGTQKEKSRISIVSPEKAEPDDNDSTEDEDSAKPTVAKRQNEDHSVDYSDDETNDTGQQDASTMSAQEAQVVDGSVAEESVEVLETENQDGASLMSAQEAQVVDNSVADEAGEVHETVEPDDVDSNDGNDGTALLISSQAEHEVEDGLAEEHSDQEEEIEQQDCASNMSAQDAQVVDSVAEGDDSVQADETEQHDITSTISPLEVQVEESAEEDDSIEVVATAQADGSESSDDENLKVMHESNQTAEERLQIRKSQRRLYSKVVETGDDLDIDEVRGENNKIFKKVCYPREAVLDGMNMNAIVTRAKDNAERLFQVPRYDADRFVSKLRAKCLNGEGYFDWDAFGTQAGTCFNAMPANVSFLNGSVTHIKEIKVKAKRKRIQVQEEEAEEEQPDEIRGRTDGDADQLSAIQRNLKSMKKTLKQTVFRTYHRNKRKMQDMYEGGEIPPKADKRLKKHGVEIDAIRFLFNPASFTQTVENIFHYSFLVKEGVGTLRVRKKGIGDNFGKKGAPGGVACHYVEEVPQNPPNTQAFVSLTMKDWRDLVKAYDVKKGDLPYRVGSAQTKSVHLAQQEEADRPSDEIKEGGVDEEADEALDASKEGEVDKEPEESLDEIKQGDVNDESSADSQ